VKRRTTYHHGDLKRTLVRSALQLEARSGGAGFSLRDLAREVGVDHSAVYRHFEDKRALMAAVAEQGFRELARRMEAATRTSGTSRERIEAIAQAYVGFALTRTPHFQVMFGPRLNVDGRFPSLEPPIAAAFGAVVSEMRRGVAEGALAPGSAQDHAVALWTMLHGFSTLVLAQKLRVRSRRATLAYLRVVVAPLLRGLEGRPQVGGAVPPLEKPRASARTMRSK
jgi:AcrR family transcriptional regulator